MGKSKAQDALMAKLKDIYPLAYIKDEIYIGNLIEDMGYTMSELTSEMGRKPHKMFVDIVMRDSERIVAFEYHGEQHYALVGNMTKTTADLAINKMMDEEKAQILERIGIPLVSIPFDMYIDESVIESLIDNACIETMKARSQLSTCGECGRMFPSNRVQYGVCRTCKKKMDEEAKKDETSRSSDRKQFKGNTNGLEHNKPLSFIEMLNQENEMGDGYDDDGEFVEYESDSFDDDASDFDCGDSQDSWEEERKRRIAEKRERDRERRKEAYQRYKQSPQYAEKKRREKEARKEAYQKRKEEMKRKKAEGLL